MKRRDFLRGLAAGAGVTLASKPTTTSAAGKKMRWRLALPVPKTLPIWGEGATRFAKQVEEVTQGSIDIRVYGAGELVPALETFDAVKQGSIQMHLSASYYYKGKVPEASFFAAIPFGMNAQGFSAWVNAGEGQALWDKLMKPHGVRCFTCGSPGYQMSGWFNKRIEKIEDLKGLKIRLPGLGGEVIARLGAKPILIAGGEIFTSLSTGVIDASEWVGPYHDYIMGFHKAAKFYYSSSWHEPGTTFELMINDKAWAQLSPTQQKLLKMCIAETDQWIATTWRAKNAEYLEKIKQETEIDIEELPDSVIKALKKEADIVVGQLAQSSPIAKEIYNSYSKFQQNFEEYNRLAELPMLKALYL